MRKNTVTIRNVEVSLSIFNTYFACDYEACKGACCWAPSEVMVNGGLLLKKEAKELRGSILTPYVPEKYQKEQKEVPCYNSIGGAYTPLDKEFVCMYCDLDGGTGCVLKKAHSEGVLSFGIPVHCELYPLLYEKRNGYGSLTLSDLWADNCSKALVKGKEEKILVYQFCRTAIERLLGGKFYKALEAYHRDLLK